MDSFRIGEWTVLPSEDRLARGETAVSLQPKAMQVLCVLANRAGDVVTAEEILEEVWPDTYAEEQVVRKRIAEIRQALTDDARSPTYIETRPKKGYRLIAVVEPLTGTITEALSSESDQSRTNALQPRPSGSPAAGEQPGHRRRHNGGRAFRFAFAIAALVAGGWYLTSMLLSSDAQIEPAADATSPTTDVTVVVVPFENLSSPKETALPLSISQSVMEQLLSFGLAVSRQPPDSVDADEWTYTLVGNTQEIGDLVRLNVQLTDSRNNTFWAQNFDLQETNGLVLQTRFGKWVAFAASWEISNQQIQRALATTEAERGPADWLNLGHNAMRESASLTEAESLYEQALALDDRYMPALVSLANLLLSQTLRGHADDPDADLQRAIDLSNQASAINGRYEVPVYLNARALWYSGQHDQAIRRLKRYSRVTDSVELRNLLALVHASQGDRAQVQANLQRAYELGMDPEKVYFVLGVLALLDGEHLGASDHFAKVINVFPSAEAYCLAITAATLGERPEEAAALFRDYRAEFPFFSIPGQLDVLSAMYPSHGDAMRASLTLAAMANISK